MIHNNERVALVDEAHRLLTLRHDGVSADQVPKLFRLGLRVFVLTPGLLPSHLRHFTRFAVRVEGRVREQMGKRVCFGLQVSRFALDGRRRWRRNGILFSTCFANGSVATRRLSMSSIGLIIRTRRDGVRANFVSDRRAARGGGVSWCCTPRFCIILGFGSR